jgi:hypothetical protein
MCYVGQTAIISTSLLLGKMTKELFLKSSSKSQALVAHVCNPSYSRGTDQENCSSRPAQANNS